MGTNYYCYKSFDLLDSALGKEEDNLPRIHLGKSSAGWCFSLHVYPESEEGIPFLYSYKGVERWLQGEVSRGGQIRDEYGTLITVENFHRIVTERSWDRDWDSDWWAPVHNFLGVPGFTLPGYKSEKEFHRSNNSERGPNNLLRHKVDGVHCIAHGSGTWDCIVGDFF